MLLQLLLLQWQFNMGRMLKNTLLRSGSYAVRVPNSPSTIGPDAPVDGQVRYNVTLNKMQYYSIDRWVNFAGEGRVLIEKDTFTGNGVDRDFGPLLYNYNTGDELSVLVFIGNVFQNPGVAFQLFGNTIRFASPPNDLQPIVVLHGYGSTVIVS